VSRARLLRLLLEQPGDPVGSLGTFADPVRGTIGINLEADFLTDRPGIEIAKTLDSRRLRESVTTT